MAQGTEKKCPSCGSPFKCFSEDDCWCEQFHLNRKEYLEIVEKFNDCLCPQCLGKYSGD